MLGVKCCWVMILMVSMMIVAMVGGEGGLAQNFYQNSCPRAESMTRTTMRSIGFSDPTAFAALLRIVFHDCQVQGCDASIMLRTNSSASISSELASGNNFGIRRLDAIDRIKSALESVCPGVVSCADIIVMAARDAVAMSGGPNIPVLTGRRDANSASSGSADASILPASVSVDRMLQVFQSQGLNTEDAVALLGAHTLGVSHCVSVVNRLYPKMDSTLPMGFGTSLRLRCPSPRPINNVSLIANDFTNLAFDNRFYKDILAGTGVLSIDQQLALDPRTKGLVNQFATNMPQFFQAFTSAFLKLTQHSVLTGSSGQIRKQCHSVNG